jgi:hypothetical protein
MSVFSSLCIYSISQNFTTVKNGKWKKMEKSGRREIAGDGYAGGCAWEGMEGRLPPKVFFLTFLRFYGILTVFSRESRKRGTKNVRIR